MSKFFRANVHTGLISFCVMASPFAVAQDDLLSVGASVQQIWDSNYARTPEEEADQITLASASVGLDKTLSRQRFLARWKGERYEHEERTDLDATVHDALVAWRGQWGSRIKTNLEWARNAYLVDRLEFFYKDIVARDDVKAEVSYGAGHRLTLSLGARQTTQTHSSDLREGLDFDEDEAFFAVAYQTGIKSTLAARVRSGQREYPNEELIMPADGEEFIAGQLDFDYEQAEIQATWVASPKTSLSATLGYFNRDGFVNTRSGALASVEAEWEMSPKVQLTGGYTFTQPAIGETSDSPTNTHSVFFDAQWHWTEKIAIGAVARVAEYQYDTVSSGPARDETLYHVTPLRVTYDPSETFSIRLAGGWTDRQSPLTYRDYSSAETTLGIFFRY